MMRERSTVGGQSTRIHNLYGQLLNSVEDGFE